MLYVKFSFLWKKSCKHVLHRFFRRGFSLENSLEFYGVFSNVKKNIRNIQVL